MCSCLLRNKEGNKTIIYFQYSFSYCLLPTIACKERRAQLGLNELVYESAFRVQLMKN